MRKLSLQRGAISLRRKLKAFVKACVGVFGYRIEKLKSTVNAPIDVLELLLKEVSADRTGFFFVQIGANDGLIDDPIRRFVTKYHWQGILVEPQPQVFQRLLKNYEHEKQLAFENTAIAEKDGAVRLFIADHRHETANLTVFASLKKGVLIRALDNPKAAGVHLRVQEVEVPAMSVQTLLAKHRITKVDLLLTDVQGYDSAVVEQFLVCGIRPMIICFEHCHTTRPTLDALYRQLVRHGYRFNEFENDTLCYLP